MKQAQETAGAPYERERARMADEIEPKDIVRVVKGGAGCEAQPGDTGRVFWVGDGKLEIRRNVKRVGFRSRNTRKKHFAYSDNLRIEKKARTAPARISYR